MPCEKQTIHLLAQHCPFCSEYGNVCFRLAAGKERVVLVCDECDATWLNPNEVSAERADAPQPPDFTISGTNSRLGAGSRWATLEEIQASGFAQFVANSYQG